MQRFQNVQSEITVPYMDDTGRVTRQVGNFVFLNGRGRVWSEPTIRRVIKNIVETQNEEVQGIG